MTVSYKKTLLILYEHLIFLIIGLLCWSCEDNNSIPQIRLSSQYVGMTSQGYDISIGIFEKNDDYEIQNIFLECYWDTTKLQDTSDCYNWSPRCNQGISPDDCFIDDSLFDCNHKRRERTWIFKGKFINQDSVSGMLVIIDTLDMCTSDTMNWNADANDL